MSATLEDLPPPPRRFRRRRLFLYSALGLIALAVIAVLLGLLYLRSESFNRFVAVEIEKALEAYGLRAEIGPLEPGLRAITLRDVKLLNRRTNQLIATINRADVSITIRDPFALRLRREIVFDRMDLDGLDLWVVINERGESNFQGLRRPPPLSRRITFDYSKLAGSLKKGAIHYIDRKRDLQSELRDLIGAARPIAGGDPPKVAIRLASGAGHLSGADGNMKIDAVEFIGRVMESGADVERLELRSPAAEVTASGRLNDWQAPDYQLDVKARAQLEEVVALSAPELSLKGGADFDGLIKGGGAQWSASGRLTSNKLSLAGVTFNGAQADGVRIEARDGGLTFSINQARARSILSEGVEMTIASATNLKGTIADGKGQATVEQAIIERIKSGQNEFNGVKLRDIRTNFAPDKTKKSREGKWTFSSARVETRSGVAGEIEFTNASASNVKGTISDGRAEFTSDQITAARAVAGQTRFNEITAQEINATFEPGRKPLGGQWTFSSARLEAKSGAAGEIELRNLAASKAQGTIASGVARVTMEQAKIERAESKQGDFNEIVMRDISASLGFDQDRKSTRLNSSHLGISYAVFCLKKKN